MEYDIDWIIPRLRKPGTLWNCASFVTIAVVGMVTKIISEWLNRTKIYNRGVLVSMLKRPVGTPLITISNHHSCFDDPGLWGSLPLTHLCSRRNLRWSLAAHDICFTNVAHSIFFMLGKCIPVVRGKGVYQPALDFCLEQLRDGAWVHLFPEGKVNMGKEDMRLKWGVGRLITECHGPTPPLVVPIWHEGMDSVLPNKEPYLLRFRKTIHVHYGEPIDVGGLLGRLRAVGASQEEARGAVTDLLQERLYQLRRDTQHIIHRHHNNNNK